MVAVMSDFGHGDGRVAGRGGTQKSMVDIARSSRLGTVLRTTVHFMMYTICYKRNR